MATPAFRRDLAAEVSKHFRGTPEERVRQALALGRDLFEMYLGTLPPGTSRAEAARRMSVRTHAGRRASRVMDLPRE